MDCTECLDRGTCPDYALDNEDAMRICSENNKVSSLSDQTVKEFARDYNLCKHAYNEYKNNQKAEGGIHFECFNQADINNLKGIMAKYFPDVPVTYSALFNGEV